MVARIIIEMDFCRSITGDHDRVTVVWTGGERAPADAAKTRFILERTFLYGYDWVE